MWGRSRDRKDVAATGGLRSSADTPAQESGSSEEPQHGDSLETGLAPEAEPSTPAAAAAAATAATAAADMPADTAQRDASTSAPSPAVEPLEPTQIEMEADPYQLEAVDTALAAATLPADAHSGRAASPAFEPPGPTVVQMESHPQQLEVVAPPAPPAPQAATPPAEVQDVWAAGLPSAAGFVLPMWQPPTEPQEAEAQPGEPVPPTDRTQHLSAQEVGAEAHPQSPAGSLGTEPQPQRRQHPPADSSGAEPLPQLQPLAPQEVQGSCNASEDLELALQRLMALPEIPCVSSATSSDEAGAHQPELLAAATELVPPAAQSETAGAEGSGAPPAPAPAAPNRRRSSVAGQALARAAHRRRSLRLMASAPQAEAHHTPAAAASPHAAGQAHATQPAGGEAADSSADILAELEAQRARHAEQVWKLGACCGPSPCCLSPSTSTCPSATFSLHPVWPLALFEESPQLCTACLLGHAGHLRHESPIQS